MHNTPGCLTYVEKQEQLNFEVALTSLRIEVCVYQE